MRRRWWFGITVLSGLFALPLTTHAASSSVLISELQTGSTTSASQEFIELYNVGDTDVPLAGWTLDYKSASGSSWTHKANLAGTIATHGFYLLSSSAYLIGADQTFSSGLSGTGGHVRIVDAAGMTVDLVGWGTAMDAEGNAPAAAPAAGQSIERVPGRLDDAGGNGVDTDNNANDFILRTTPEPQSTAATAETPDLSIVSDTPVDEVAPPAPTYLPLMLTELLVNPASPKLDSQDEFIEIYNPNDEDVNVQDYTLRTGSNFHDFYNLPSAVLPAGQYAVYYSGTSHLSLTNSGGAAQLLDPTGVVVSQTDSYSVAKSDQVWGLFDGVWAWSTTATPGVDNILTVPEVVSAAVKSTAAKTTVAKKAAVPKLPKSTKVSKVTTKKIAPKKSTTSASYASVSDLVPSSSGAGWLLGVLASLTIGYAIYEFKSDLQNYYHLARRKFGSRSKYWPFASRRRDH